MRLDQRSVMSEGGEAVTGPHHKLSLHKLPWCAFVFRLHWSWPEHAVFFLLLKQILADFNKQKGTEKSNLRPRLCTSTVATGFSLLCQFIYLFVHCWLFPVRVWRGLLFGWWSWFTAWFHPLMTRKSDSEQLNRRWRTRKDGARPLSAERSLETREVEVIHHTFQNTSVWNIRVLGKWAGSLF